MSLCPFNIQTRLFGHCITNQVNNYFFWWWVGGWGEWQYWQLWQNWPLYINKFVCWRSWSSAPGQYPFPKPLSLIGLFLFNRSWFMSHKNLTSFTVTTREISWRQTCVCMCCPRTRFRFFHRGTYLQSRNFFPRYFSYLLFMLLRAFYCDRFTMQTSIPKHVF